MEKKTSKGAQTAISTFYRIMTTKLDISCQSLGYTHKDVKSTEFVIIRPLPSTTSVTLFLKISERCSYTIKKQLLLGGKTNAIT
jgi:hypothetical protein